MKLANDAIEYNPYWNWFLKFGRTNSKMFQFASGVAWKSKNTSCLMPSFCLKSSSALSWKLDICYYIYVLSRQCIAAIYKELCMEMLNVGVMKDHEQKELCLIGWRLVESCHPNSMSFNLDLILFFYLYLKCESTSLLYRSSFQFLVVQKDKRP